jgi:hypothetical protein
MPYSHKEAFALMWYACPCGHRERIWNSRDGVTPFGGIRCPSCGSTTPRPQTPGDESDLAKALRKLGGQASPPGMEHVFFGSDECRPDHKPHPGQRIWRDGTPADAVAILERRFKAFANRGQAVPDQVRDRMMADAREGREEWMAGWPMLERTPEIS